MTRLNVAFNRALDANVDPVSGGKLYVYSAGTTTPVSTYSDDGLSLLHPHPVLADSSGNFPTIYVAEGPYKVVVKDADDVTLYETDNVDAFDSGRELWSFDTRAAALVGDTGTATYIRVADILYIYDASGTALTTGDGRTWTPSGEAILARAYGLVTSERDDARTDYQTELQAALTYGHDVVVLDGWVQIDDMITVGADQTLVFLGDDSGLYIDSGFNMAADAVVDLGAGAGTQATGGNTENLQIWFEQQGTDGTILADMVQYPWAVQALSPQFRMDGQTRILRGWDGINCQGNPGRSEIVDLTISCFNENFHVDGSLGFIKVNTFRCIPQGMSTTGSGNALVPVWEEANPWAIRADDCDGLSFDTVECFKSRINTDAGTALIPHIFGTVKLDGDGSTWTHESGRVMIGELYSTKTSSSTVPSVSITSGFAQVSMLQFIGNETAQSISVAGGTLEIHGGYLNNNNGGQALATVSSGVLTLRGVTFDWTTSRTVAAIQQSGTGSLIVDSSCRVIPTAAATIIDCATDVAANDIQSWNLKPHTATLFDTKKGNYQVYSAVEYATAAGGAAFNLTTFANSGEGWNLNFQRALGTGTSPLAITSGTNIGDVFARGWDGTDWVEAGYMRAIANDTVSTGVVPMEWRLAAMNSAGALNIGGYVKPTGLQSQGESDITLTFETRADFITWIGTYTPAVGTVALADGWPYLYTGSTTNDIPDATGWFPTGFAVTPQHFGADATGVSASSTAIHNAIAYVATATPRPLGIVWVPKGDYLCDSTITGRNGVMLQGAGKTATRLYRTGSYGHTYHQTSGAPYIDGIWFEHGTKFDSSKGDGTELVTNGNMSSATGWTLGTGWSIGSGVATGAAGTASDLINDGATVTAGKIYLITYQILNYSAGVVTAEAGNTSGTSNSGNGWYMDFVVATDTSAAAIRKNSLFAGDIDNFSCVLVGDPLDNRQTGGHAHVRLENCARGKISNCYFSRMQYQVDFFNSQNITLENNEYFSTWGPITELQEGIAQVRYGDGNESGVSEKCSLMRQINDLHTGSTVIMSTEATTYGLVVTDGSGNYGSYITNDELNIGPQFNLIGSTCEMFESVATYYDRASTAQVKLDQLVSSVPLYGWKFVACKFDNGAGDMSAGKQVHFAGGISRAFKFLGCQFYGGRKCLNGIVVDRDGGAQTLYDLSVVDCNFMSHVGGPLQLDGVTGFKVQSNTFTWWNSRLLANVDKDFTAAINLTANVDLGLISGNILGGGQTDFEPTTENQCYQGIYMADTSVDVTVRGNKNVGVVDYFTNAGFIVDSLTISGGVVAVDFDDLHGLFVIDTEASAATDDLDTINGGRDGQIIVCRQANAARDVTFKDGTGNLQLAGDYAMTAHRDTITLMWDETVSLWLELSRSDNN